MANKLSKGTELKYKVFTELISKARHRALVNKFDPREYLEIKVSEHFYYSTLSYHNTYLLHQQPPQKYLGVPIRVIPDYHKDFTIIEKWLKNGQPRWYPPKYSKKYWQIQAKRKRFFSVYSKVKPRVRVRAKTDLIRWDLSSLYGFGLVSPKHAARIGAADIQPNAITTSELINGHNQNSLTTGHMLQFGHSDRRKMIDIEQSSSGASLFDIDQVANPSFLN